MSKKIDWPKVWEKIDNKGYDMDILCQTGLIRDIQKIINAQLRSKNS